MAFWDEAGCKICVAESGFFSGLCLIRERGRHRENPQEPKQKETAS